MFTKKRAGDVEFIEPPGMCEDKKDMLKELLSQNRAILENNMRMIEALSSPVFFIKHGDGPDA